jgi:(2R)-3-sulfolactate dehydrogenase (NADP+)
MPESRFLDRTEAEVLVIDILTRHDVAQEAARSVACALTAAEADGQEGHGLSRVPAYAAQAKIGKIKGHAVPVMRQTAPSVLSIDAGEGFAYPAIDKALERLPALARAQGIAVAGISASHHAGQAGRHAERLAEVGLVGLVVANTPAAMAFPGGKRAFLGTNPLAFAAPLPDRAPLVIDLALSLVARSKIVAAQRKGASIPPEWASDADGHPTTDPAQALAGALSPIGGAKGAALALMVEILCGALAGGHFGWQASSFLDDKGGPPRTGQTLLALDPAAFAGPDFLPRMGALAADIAAEGGRLPGDRRLERRREAAAVGLSLPSALFDTLQRLKDAAA